VTKRIRLVEPELRLQTEDDAEPERDDRYGPETDGGEALRVSLGLAYGLVEDRLAPQDGGGRARGGHRVLELGDLHRKSGAVRVHLDRRVPALFSRGRGRDDMLARIDDDRLAELFLADQRAVAPNLELGRRSARPNVDHEPRNERLELRDALARMRF